MARRATLAKQEAFLDAYEIVATIIGAAKRAGISQRIHYFWLVNDPTYPVRFARAEEAATQRLEQEARRRALIGVSKPVFQNGKQVGSVQEYSDALTIFLLKSRRPEKYRERYDHTVTVDTDNDLSKMSREALLARLEQIKSKLLNAPPAPDGDVIDADAVVETDTADADIPNT